MSMPVLRHALSYAKPGQGDRLAELLVQVAKQMRNLAGCEEWIVCRVAGEPDAVAVRERWASEQAMHDALASAADDELFPQVLELLDRERSPGPVDLQPIEGPGYLPSPPRDWSHEAISTLEDLAPKFGMGETGETRSLRRGLGLTQIGSQHYVMRPGARQGFGHTHANAEELYVVLAGSGRVALDEEVRELSAGDALRVGPGVVRAFEAGDAGMTLLAVGAHRPGDGDLLPGWWAGEATGRPA